MVLSLITVLLVAGPFVMAFASNDWDIESMVSPPQEEMEDALGQFEAMEELGGFEPVEEDVDDETGEVKITFEFDSPLGDDITVRKFSADLYLDDEKSGSLELAEKTVLSAGERTEFDLVGFIDTETMEDAVVQNVHEDEISDEELIEMVEEDQEDLTRDVLDLDLRDTLVDLEIFGLEVEIREFEEMGDLDE